jgi:serine/threonine-protein kinase
MEGVPVDLLPVIRAAGILNDRQLSEIKRKVLQGDYPNTTIELADRLVQDGVLTNYQARRLLKNKPHGLVISRYVILDRLGSGAMGRVYKAHHLLMGRSVAIKIIAPEIASNARVVARFQREMKLVGRLDHPNVVRAFDADQLGQMLFIVMEYVPGQSLAHRLRLGPIPPIEMISYGTQAALGLAHAHGQGIVHRDVKPSNLLLNQSGQVKVLDLGLGVLMEVDTQATFATADGIAVGTVDYMSPEQASGRDVDGRSDIYSLGCSMYYLMTGQLPFPGETPIDRLAKRIGGNPVPITDVRPDIPPSLVRVLDKMTAQKPHERFQTAQETAEALQSLTRPKRKPTAPAPGPATPRESKEGAHEPSPAPAPAPPPPPVIVKVRPDYPAWFQPLANLSERRPAGALAAVIGALVTAFALGFSLAKLWP